MKLFDEMEKCFPEIEKQWDKIFFLLGDDFLIPSTIQGAETVLCNWIIEHYLEPESELYCLFVQAGFQNPRHMGKLMIDWMHYARHSAGRPYINQTGTFFAQE